MKRSASLAVRVELDGRCQVSLGTPVGYRRCARSASGPSAQTQLLDITDADRRQRSTGSNGATAALVFVPHTTAGVTINEHADPAVARDFEAALERMVGDDWGWQHIEEGEENAPSHVRASLMSPQVLVPLDGGQLALGTLAGDLLLRVRRAARAQGLRHDALH